MIRVAGRTEAGVVPVASIRVVTTAASARAVLSHGTPIDLTSFRRRLKIRTHSTGTGNVVAGYVDPHA